MTHAVRGRRPCHVRAGHLLFNIAFPVIFGVVLWLGRDRRLRALVPWRS